MNLIRTSEFWVAIATGLGQVAVQLGWMTQDSWNNVIFPAIVYIFARISGKVAKATVK